MPVKKGGYIFLIAITLFAIFISLLSFSIAYEHPFDLSVRLFALNGFLTISIATIMTPFMKEVKSSFDTPFVRVHHSFAAVGLALATLHPVAYAIQTLDPAVFVPNFQSWNLFWALGGRQALIIVYIAAIAAFFRRTAPRYWRPIHALMYVALFFAIVHANLLGEDFQNIVISVVFNSLFAASIVTFCLKRMQQYRIRRFIRQ
jgi:DMSO/TMAO reductase YedYZ heme-binding membrane subunit